MTRREFFMSTGASGALAAVTGARLTGQPTERSPDERGYWLVILRRLADPILRNLANGTLRARMPVEQAAGASRGAVTHLEALGRLMAGIAPWIDLLAQMALRKALPEGVSPAQVRGALSAVIHRSIEAPGTFDANGWLRIGLCGYQPVSNLRAVPRSACRAVPDASNH